jgi:hypothetical protein
MLKRDVPWAVARALMVVLRNSGGNRGDESRGFDRFFVMEVVLIIGVFSVFHLLDDAVNCHFPIDRLH